MVIHEIKGFIQSTFLIEEEHGLLLLDSACRCDVNNLLRKLNSLAPRKLKLIALSHNHPDHCGGAYELQQKTGCQIGGPQGLSQWYQGLSGRLTYFIDIALTYYVAYRLRKNLFQNVFFKPDLWLHHYFENQMNLPDFLNWKALKLPGHTPLDTCFFHAKSQTLYVGDLLILNRKKLIRPYPIYEPENYKRSLQIIKDLKPKTLLLAHGGIYHPDENFVASLDHLCQFTAREPRTHHFLFKILLRRLFKIS